MRVTATLVSALVAAGAQAQNTALPPQPPYQGDAPIVADNPAGVVYRASLPAEAFTKALYPQGGNVKGAITAVSNPNGVGVLFKVTFSNLPKQGGPFMYHLHDAPVPANGNCTATLAHHDPFIRGEATDCDPKNPKTCQVGDLSGKYGHITSDPYVITYSDPYASLKPGIGAFFGNRSFVLHLANKTRITCANFAQIQGATTLPDDCGTEGGAKPQPGSNSTGTVPGAAQPTGGQGATTGRPTQVVTAGAAIVERGVWAVGAASLFAMLVL